jgi:hypothetical protein
VPDSSHLRRLPRPLTSIALVLAVASTVGVVATPSAGSAPVPPDASAYALCGRVFPDPQAHWPATDALPTESPFAKGNAACRAADFLGFDETIAGLRLLEDLLPDYVELYDLSDDDGPLADALDLSGGEGMSAGLATVDLKRDKAPMYLLRITDEAADEVAIEDREHFVFGLSIHGIERAGVEGGIRAAEDLATWAACEADSDALPTCELNGPYPHPILETLPEESTTAGDALRHSSVWFVLSNPDGWQRGDKQQGGFFYQRYNGNGMDLNRDWPNPGYTFRPFTPFSEPETRGVGKALQAIKPKWTGGIDLHGQLIDRAFSFTLIGGTQRPFDKDRRVLQFVKGAFADAEQRLAWSPLIKANDEPEACVPPGTSGEINEPPGCDPSSRLYGVQWGTIWDTIAYTTPGAFGDWVDAPLGLDADGIDNEMSLSHLSNCGVGSCYLPMVEQLHVDGNKSLIYSMIHYSLVPEDTTFGFEGTAAWLHHDGRISEPGSSASTAPPSSLPAQHDIEVDLIQPAQTTYEFDVLGASDGVANAGLSVTFTAPSRGVSALAVQSLSVDRLVDGEWEVVNSYYNQSPIYLQAGARIDVNLPEPGQYRVTTSGEGAGPLHVAIDFADGQAWPDPGQVAYDVSNLDFFDDLRPFAGSSKLAPAAIEDVVDGTVDLGEVDSLVIADGAYLPGLLLDPAEPAAPDGGGGLPIRERDITGEMSAQATTGAVALGDWTAADEAKLLAALRAFVEGGGNLVLTDDGLRVVERLGLVPEGSVTRTRVYAGFVEFSTDDGSTDTYGDPLAANVDQPGSAEGPGHRHQMSEPIPTGWKILDDDGADTSTMPEWVIDPAAWTDAGGRVVGMADGGVSLGELPVGDGRITVLGSLLPVPTTEYDHPFGLSSYGVTYSGYEVLRNLLDWRNPNRAAQPGSSPVHVLSSSEANRAGGPRLPATGRNDGLTPLLALIALAAGLGGRALVRRRKVAVPPWRV